MPRILGHYLPAVTGVGTYAGLLSSSSSSFICGLPENRRTPMHTPQDSHNKGQINEFLLVSCFSMLLFDV